jgi:hypothetical protein
MSTGIVRYGHLNMQAPFQVALAGGGKSQLSHLRGGTYARRRLPRIKTASEPSDFADA